MASFSKKAAISYGYSAMKKNFGFFVVILLTLVAANLLPGIISSSISHGRASLPAFLVTLFGWGLQTTIDIGIIGVVLKIYNKKSVKYKALFDYVYLIIPYFIASIIYSAIVVAGFILLIIPGIIWSIKFRFYPYFMIDRKMGPIDALKASSKLTRGNKWNLFLLGVLLGLINIVGVLLLLVGLFATIPISMMAETYVYRKLLHKKT
jgi:uncharacterized membrane protein